MTAYRLEAENRLAGCLLVAPRETVPLVRGLVSAGDFQNGNARAVYEAACALVNAGKAADPVLIQAESERRGTPLSHDWCAQQMQLSITTADAAETARLIREAAQERAGREIGLALAEEALSPAEALERLQTLLRENTGRATPPEEATMVYMDALNKAAAGRLKPFLSTGFSSLDRQLAGGLVAGGLITLAARPGTGKTTAALHIAENVAAAGGKVLYVSLEMPLQQIWNCRTANLSGVSRSVLAAGTIPEDDTETWRRISEAQRLLYERPFYIRDVPATLEEIEREARCLDGLGLLVVDHIGLIRPAERGSRYEIMTATAHGLKQLALSLGIPILALCQLNRQSEQRDSRRPSMADLRDSGAIEEDSDAVILLYRPAVYAPEAEKPKPWEAQELDFFVEKNRHGATGRVTMNLCGMTSRIMEVLMRQ